MPTSNRRLPQQFKHGPRAPDGRGLAADHDGECGIGRARHAAGHGRVHEQEAQAGQGCAERARTFRLGGTHVDDEGALGQLGGNSARSHEDLAHDRPGGEHGHDHVRPAEILGPLGDTHRGLGRQALRRGHIHIKHHEGMPGTGKMARHGTPHRAQTDKSDVDAAPRWLGRCALRTPDCPSIGCLVEGVKQR